MGGAVAAAAVAEAVARPSERRQPLRPDEHGRRRHPASSSRWPARPTKPATKPSAVAFDLRRASASGGCPTRRCCCAPRPARARPRAVIESVAAQLTETLGHFGVEARVINTISGPRVTQYELALAPGTKVSRVAALRDDIAYALAATEIRVQAPIPGKSAVGVEVPNREPNWVSLGDIHGDLPVNASPLAMWIGKDITGKPVLADLHAPHPRADRRHHRLGQERLPEQHRELDPAARHARPGALHHDRPQEGRALALRRRAAPAGAGRHQRAQRRRRAGHDHPRDGAPLRPHDAHRQRPRPARAEQAAHRWAARSRCPTS